jgi:putative toxin-antitoxin system antitoxin component (TIGR02293 family)
MPAVKTHRATLATLGTRAAEKPARYRARTRAAASGALIALDARSVPFDAVATLGERVGAAPEEILAIVAIAARTAARRKAERFFKPEEADRILRLARVVAESERVFGDRAKAGAWLRASHPLLGGETPLALLGSDAGAKAVSDELVRIDHGDFA